MDTALTETLSPMARTAVEGITAESFDCIVRQEQRRVYRMIFLLVRDADAANALTQECFLRAYVHRNSFRGECRVETWLLRIALNLVRDHGRNRRVSFWKKLVDMESAESSPAAFTAPHPSPERVLIAQQELQQVWSATEELSQQQRTIFLLRFVEEMQLAEIAATLNLRVGSVKAQLSRAIHKIRETVRESQ